MNPISHDWSFLPEAWKYALVLTARESAATALVSDSLATLSKRHDLGDSIRARRLLFSILYHQGTKIPRESTPESTAEKNIFPLHELEEPSRSAITLLYLGLFSAEHLAGLFGQSESELANTLSRARAALTTKFALPT